MELKGYINLSSRISIVLVCAIILYVFSSPSVNARVMFQMDWEGASITDAPAGFSSMVAYYDTESPANIMTQATSGCFAGSKCLQIDWKTKPGCPGLGEVECAREVYLSTPNVMGSTHEYYVGFAVKFPTSWRNGRGRKILYRTGNNAESVLFQGTKGIPCGQSSSNCHIYFKNPGNLGGGTEDDPWNELHSEKNGVGGPRCQSYTSDPCVNWPGAEGFPFIESDGKWHTIIYYIKEHLTEGANTLWIDGFKVVHIDKNSWNNTRGLVGGPCAATYYNTAHADFDGFKFPTYFNFGPPANQSEYWDNFIVATTLEEVATYLNVTIRPQPPSAVTGLHVLE